MYNRALPSGKARVIAQQPLAARMFNFCGLNTLVGYGATAEAMARWQAAQVSAIITLTPLFTLFFRSFITGTARFLRQTDVKPLGYLGAFVVVAGAMYSAIGHRIWGGLRKHTTVVSQPRAGE